MHNPVLGYLFKRGSYQVQKKEEINVDKVNFEFSSDSDDDWVYSSIYILIKLRFIFICFCVISAYLLVFCSQIFFNPLFVLRCWSIKIRFLFQVRLFYNLSLILTINYQKCRSKFDLAFLFIWDTDIIWKTRWSHLKDNQTILPSQKFANQICSVF